MCISIEHKRDHEQEYNQNGRKDYDKRDGEEHEDICTTAPGDSEPTGGSVNIADDNIRGHDSSRVITHDNTVRQCG